MELKEKKKSLQELLQAKAEQLNNIEMIRAQLNREISEITGKLKLIDEMEKENPKENPKESPKE